MPVFAAVGGWVVGAVGTAFGAASASAAVAAVGTTITSAIGGAIVGAAIGGISSAIMGGDIGKGMLYGAIGGAVSGGISGYMAGASSVITTPAGQTVQTVGGSQAAQLAAAESAMLKGTAAAGGGVTEVGKATSGILGGIGESTSGLLTQGALQLGGQVLEGMGAEEQAELAAAEAQKDRDLKMAMLEKQLASAESQSRSSGGTDNTAAHLQYKAAMAKLDEERRQFDTNLSEMQNQRKTASGALAGARAARRGKLDYSPLTIEEQVFMESQGNYQEAPQVPLALTPAPTPTPTPTPEEG